VGLFAHFFILGRMNQAHTTYKEKIEWLIKPLVESENMELVNVECLRMKSRWLVRVYIDKEGGVTLGDCTEISHQVGDVLDIHDIPPGPYTLEVSSPGLDRPLVKDADFLKYRGHLVRVRLREKAEGSRNLRGRLMDFQEEDGKKILVLEVEGKTFRIPKENLVRANLVYEL
jgi:ribosome maturation factor RimP